MQIGELILALVGLVLQCCLFALIWRRGLHRRVGFFFAYNLYAVGAEIVRFVCRNHPATYFQVYWLTEALYAILAFLAIREAFRWVFRNFYRLKGFWTLLPAVTLLTLIIVALRLRQTHAAETYAIVGIIISAEITVNFLQLGILALFIFLVRFFHVGWLQHAFGMVLGFGISAAGPLAVFLLRSEFGTKFDPIVRITPPIAYIIAVLVWLWTFLRVEPPHPMQGWAPALTPEQMVFELRRYTKAVKDMLGR